MTLTDADRREVTSDDAKSGPRLLALDEAATRLGMTPRMLRDRCRARQITYVEGRPPKFREADLEAYLEAQLVPAQRPEQPDPLAAVEQKRAQQAKNLRRRRDPRAA
jgi:hypothetical protein